MVKYIYFIKQEKYHFFYNYFFLIPEPAKRNVPTYIYLQIKIIVLNSC